MTTEKLWLMMMSSQCWTLWRSQRLLEESTDDHASLYTHTQYLVRSPLWGEVCPLPIILSSAFQCPRSWTESWKRKAVKAVSRQSEAAVKKKQIKKLCTFTLLVLMLFFVLLSFMLLYLYLPPLLSFLVVLPLYVCCCWANAEGVVIEWFHHCAYRFIDCCCEIPMLYL